MLNVNQIQYLTEHNLCQLDCLDHITSVFHVVDKRCLLYYVVFYRRHLLYVYQGG